MENFDNNGKNNDNLTHEKDTLNTPNGISTISQNSFTDSNEKQAEKPSSSAAKQPNKKPKKPIYKKWWFWVIISAVLLIIAIPIIVIGLIVVLLLLNPNKDTTENINCSHDYVVSSSEATCTEGGYITYKCRLCNGTKKEYKSALGHLPLNGTCLSCGEAIVNWQIGYYVDEFNVPTNQAFIRNSDLFYGTFSNSATEDSILSARILIDKDDIAIQLWEYANYQVKAYSSTEYSITVLDDNGTKHYLSGNMYKSGDRIVLSDRKLINLLKNNDKLKIYLRESGSVSTYLFIVNNDGFNSVYTEYINNYD